jgi:hypothetical protein
LAGAVENAIGSSAWELFYQFIDYGSAMAIIHEGGIEGDYLPAEMRDDCAVCEEIGDYVHVWYFDEDIDPWNWEEFPSWHWGAVHGYDGGGAYIPYSEHDYFSIGAYWIGKSEGEDPVHEDTIRIHRLAFWYRTTAAAPNGPDLEVDILQGDGSTVCWTNEYPETNNVWTYVDKVLGTPCDVDGDALAVRFRTVDGVALYMELDEILIDFTYIPG